jgi:hypothetical protein
MADRARNRTIRVIQSLDGMRRQLCWYVCRLTTQIAESPLDEDGTITDTIITAATKAADSLLKLRARLIRQFFQAYPGHNLTEAERDYDPTAQLIWAQRTP